MSSNLSWVKFSLRLVATLLLATGLDWAACHAADDPIEQSATETTASASEGDSDTDETDTGGAADDEQESRATNSPVLRALGRAFGSIFGVGNSPDYSTSDEELSELVGEVAPSFELQSLQGEKITLEQLRGKVVVLDFWATWCGPCMAAMPQLQKVHESFEGKPVVVIGVNQQEDRTDVEEVVAEKGFQFTQLLDADSTVGDAFLVSGIPQTVVIDTEGVVQAVHVGYSPRIKSLLSGQIDRLLNGEDLFDPVKVAEARQRRKERREKLLAQLGPMNPERLTRLGEVLVDSSVSISNNYRPALWTKFPHLPGDTLTLMAGSRRLLMVHPGSNQAQTIDLEFDEDASIWDYCPIVSGEQVFWTILGAKYDDNYNVTRVLALLDNDGKQLWSHTLAKLDVESTNSVDIVAGDLTRDGTSEIAMVVEYNGLARAGVTGPDGSTRVLSLFDLEGHKLFQAWIPGRGGEGVHLLPESEGDTLLMATSEGLTRFRITEAPAQADQVAEQGESSAVAPPPASEATPTAIP